jgi:hypothetical protein
MAKRHPFALLVEPHHIFDNRYRWRILKDSASHTDANDSYATSETAQAAGEKAMQKLVENWKPEK